MSSPLALAPVFFVSYSRTHTGRGHQGRPQEPDRYVIQFYDDLKENIAQLVSRAVGVDPGFIDRTIPDGGQWTSELLWALGTCKVFVALLSAPYVESEWCGKEWYAFSQRKVAGGAAVGANHQTAILPVTWAPLPPGMPLPSAITAVQRFVPDGLPEPEVAALYRRDGVYGLMAMRQETAYKVVVWRLAQRIAELQRNYSVEPRVFKPRDLRNIFLERGQ